MFTVVRSTRLIGALVALALAGMLTTRTIDIAPGDTLSELAVSHGVTVAELAELNDIADPDLILAGETLVVQVEGEDGSTRSYVVRYGDTLSELADRFDTTVTALVAANELSDPDRITSGQRLALGTPPAVEGESDPSTSSYVVNIGDTLLAIARSVGIPATELITANDLSDPDRILAGQRLTIPSSAPAGDDPPATTTTAPPATTTTTAPPTTTTTAPPATTTVPAPAEGSGTGLAVYFDRWSVAYGTDRSLLEALLWRESSWSTDLVGSGGRLGMSQLSPETVEFIEQRLLGLDLDPLDASDGIQMAARYLRYLEDRTPDERTALAAWRQGLRSVDADGVSAAAGAFADDVLAIRSERS